MATYPVTGVTLAQEDRLISSGPLRGILLADGRSRIWQGTYWQLLNVLPDGLPGQSEEVFIFDPAPARQTLTDLGLTL